VLIGSDQGIKVLDSDLSKNVTSLSVLSNKTSASGTSSTYAWTAPEVLAAKCGERLCTEQSDVYSYDIKLLVSWEVLPCNYPLAIQQ
jgi:Protein tyrosine and serine/threonine kinase